MPALSPRCNNDLHLDAANTSGSISGKTNYELLLAIIVLIALLIGWIGGSVTGASARSAATVAAVVSFAAGGYTGIRETLIGIRHGKFDIDFFDDGEFSGAAAIGEWEEGAVAALPLYPERCTGNICDGPHTPRHRIVLPTCCDVGRAAQ